jgi:hypothetical protein
MIDWPRRKPKSAGSGWVRDAVANVIVGRASVCEPCGGDGRHRTAKAELETAAAWERIVLKGSMAP